MQPAPSHASPNPSSGALLWLIALAGAVIAGWGFTVIDNLIKGIYRTRAHNTLLLVNECLAEHQSAYVLFFLGLLGGSTKFARDWIKPALDLLCIVGFVFYCIGVAITANQEQRLKRLHGCVVPICLLPVPWQIGRKLLWPNLLTAGILIVSSIYLCFAAQTPPGP